MDKKRRLTAVIVLLVIVPFFIWMGYLNFNLRQKMSGIEIQERINPILETLKLTSETDCIITDVPAIFHLYASDERIVISSKDISTKRVLELLSNESTRLFFLKRIEDGPNRIDTQYYIKSTNLQLLKIKSISETYELIKITN